MTDLMHESDHVDHETGRHRAEMVGTNATPYPSTFTAQHRAES